MNCNIKNTSETNLANMLWKVLSQSQHNWQYCFLVRGGDKEEIYITAKQLLDAAIKIATRFNKITHTEFVILSMEPGQHFLKALIACIFAGKIIIPTPLAKFGLHTHRFTEILNLCKNAVILSSSKNITAIKAALSEKDLQIQNTILTIEQLESDISPSNIDLLPGFAKKNNKPIIIQFTSGSTHQAKGVMISPQNILANHYEVATRWHFHQDKTLLTWLPYFHDMGLFGGLLYPLLSGQKIVQIDPIYFIQKPQRWLLAIDKFKVQFSGGPAFAYELCNDLPFDDTLEKINLSSWEVAFCGADYVPAKTMKTFRSKFKQNQLNPAAVIPVYGLAEATLFVAGQPHPQHQLPTIYNNNLTEGCYLGAFNPTHIKIRDPISKKILPHGQIGEICILGASLSQGYYNKSSDYSYDISETGDLGIIQDGYLFICGRKKDIIIHNGQNISPIDIEQIAASICNTLNPHAAAAFQLELPENKIFLLIEVKQKVKAILEEQQNIRTAIIQQVRQRLGISLFKVSFLKRGELMRTSSGKVKRQEIAKAYQSGHIFQEVTLC